jgi:proteasome lid subunit RPN8/RPN11
MFFRKKRDETPPKKEAASKKGSNAQTSVSVRAAASPDKPVHRSFPGPRHAPVLLRVAVERSAYAELIAHAKESLEVEVCGVLAGQICQDEEGLFVHVEAVIRGSAASQSSTHVTFTQATWNAIHQSLERDHPKLRMVGWYHTHPGFGVEFSEMDLFIQRNFFSGPTQIALVTDPLSGAVAICLNTPDGIEYLARFWVDGREQPCRAPERSSVKPGIAMADAAPAGDVAQAVQALESRVNQLVQVVDEQRASFHRFLLFIGVVACLGIVVSVGYLIYSQFVSRNEPPKLNQYVPIPVQVGDKTVLLGVGVAEWQVPPELNAAYLQLEQLKREAEAKAAKEAAKKAGQATNSAPATNPATGDPKPNSIP